MDIKPIDFDPLKNCRICLLSYNEMAEIFGIRNDYRDILRDYCRVDVEVNDGLPTVLCEFCIKELMQTYNFIEKCQDTDKKLRLAIRMSMKSEITAFAAQELDNEFAIKEETEDQHDSFENDTNDFDTDTESKQIDNNINSIKVKLKKCDTYPIKCSHCSIVLKCESIKIIHMRTHTNEKPYQCSQCGKCFRTKGVLKSHMTIHRDKSKDCLLDPSCRFECNFCHKIFPRKSDLIVHTRIHTGETPYSCKHCNRAFTQVSSLQRHTKIHTGERPYKCKICNKNFSTADGVRKHQVVHTNERNHNCTMCGLLFKTNTALKSHVEIVHRNSKTVVCEQCGTSFNTPGNLKAHLINIHSEQSGHCYVCNKDFKNIEEHNVQHSGQKPFECDSCEKKFSSKHSLTIHIRRHESVNKFPCVYEKCAKSFPLKTMLNHHILKYHRKYMPHTCKRCKRGFYRLSDLTRHIKFNHSCVPNISEDLKNNEMEDKEKKYKALLKVDDSN